MQRAQADIAAATVASPPASASKNERFHYTAKVYLLLCNAVSEAGAHIVPRKKKLKLMEKTSKVIIDAFPAAVGAGYQ